MGGDFWEGAKYGAISGAVSGAVMGGIQGYMDAQAQGRNPWTGRPKNPQTKVYVSYQKGVQPIPEKHYNEDFNEAFDAGSDNNPRNDWKIADDNHNQSHFWKVSRQSETVNYYTNELHGDITFENVSTSLNQGESITFMGNGKVLQTFSSESFPKTYTFNHVDNFQVITNINNGGVASFRISMLWP